MPHYILKKLRAWIDAIVHEGIREVRRSSGYHDEPLKADRTGQRSIRLSKQYRAIYIEHKGEFELIEIIEVNSHDY